MNLANTCLILNKITLISVYFAYAGPGGHSINNFTTNSTLYYRPTRAATLLTAQIIWAIRVMVQQLIRSKAPFGGVQGAAWVGKAGGRCPRKILWYHHCPPLKILAEALPYCKLYCGLQYRIMKASYRDTCYDTQPYPGPCMKYWDMPIASATAGQLGEIPLKGNTASQKVVSSNHFKTRQYSTLICVSCIFTWNKSQPMTSQIKMAYNLITSNFLMLVSCYWDLNLGNLNLLISAIFTRNRMKILKCRIFLFNLHAKWSTSLQYERRYLRNDLS